ncbi:hypothetical protein DMN91_011674 [Ooceraea biroi]|uniref:HAT C-terminal dimerisation domain-containing protein n=2 Tax=Ooceraea biroi TaxID=2015173 RepID=A0A3L8D616_OOCBI|nr:hypothetical protein DMN91_011674 [Ooceraea biroi]
MEMCHRSRGIYRNTKDLTAMILTKISKDGLDIQNCRGQAYDNAAVMAGVHTRVQVRIKSINPRAQFVACTNHSLNLAGIHAASEAVQSVTFFGTVEQVFVFFSSSTHRWGTLTAVTGQGVKRLIETRWSARHEAVEAFKNHFSDILNVLEKLASDTNENIVTRSEAGLLLKALQSLSFLCYLGLWSQVLKEVNDAQNYLQTKGLNIEQCATKVPALQEFLVGNRNSLVDNAFSYAKKLCDDLSIDLEPRRRRIRNDIFGNGSQGAVLSYEDELRREMYTLLDRIIQEMTSRFQQLQDLSEKFSFLTPSKLLDPQYVCDLGGTTDEINQAEFLVERQRLQQFIGASDRHESLKNEGPLELLRFIQEFSLGISVPNIVIMLRLFLTLAISVASCERSFSKLKLIKNYLRSTMTQLRLSNLAILSIEQTMTNRLSFDDAIKDFATRKARKIFCEFLIFSNLLNKS